MSQQRTARHTGFTILCHYLSVTVRGLRGSLSVTGNGGDPVWSSSGGPYALHNAGAPSEKLDAEERKRGGRDVPLHSQLGVWKTL